MKHFILILALFASFAYGLDKAIIDETKAKIGEYGVACIDSEKPTPEDVSALMKHSAPPTRAGRCVLFCVSKKLGLMTEDGQLADIPQSEIIEKIKADDAEVYNKLSQLHDLCKDRVEKSKDGCDASLELFSCTKYEAQKLDIDKLFF
ncbi:unnamed protein product [Ceutorhynchus assimilis]|uniref:Uncharacterized protein n=1 Tax=Ceutorhynchus assimilis TaxID=467358 RepID=A0A9N9QL26_9CUCU|nr:unnamed protein product [Ceutorhynchus assimilis]